MATQLENRGPHPHLRSAKSGPSHFLEFTPGVVKNDEVFITRSCDMCQFAKPFLIKA